ncbi:MAG: FdhF/YdeP family oxidoreductase [Neomegalonema sp.]|nr:FdhF/YdeP family oxidoreductase [Neomegalonema sp.]
MPDDDPIRKPSPAAGGWGALRSVSRELLRSGKPVEGAKTLLTLNQSDGFDCPGCAWGDPEHGSSFEFCENGVKAVAWEATSARAGPEFFAAHTLSQLREWSDHDLEKQGRLTHPLRYDPASDRYEPIAWEDAFTQIAEALRALESPDQAEFYTSGRASNEAAFLYQLFVRLYGTNNFPDCSHMCHEASGVALTEAIGTGKGTVRLEDFERCDLIYCVGQNPGTNHPRMLKSLRDCVARGAQVCVFNTLKEKGLDRFSDPQNKLEMMRGGSEPTSTHYFRPRLGGDMAVFRGMSKCVLEAEDRAQAQGLPPVLDHAFIEAHTAGFSDWCAMVRATPWAQIEAQSGLSRAQIEAAATLYLRADRVITTWAMGITQHLHSVQTIREIASFMFLKGNIGREGAGLCPVRGHSNVQGDRTVGINEKAPAALLDALEAELGVPMPRTPGHNVAEAIGAMLAGEARAFIALGGNFARAVPDTPLIAQGFAKLDLTVSIATKLNTSHLLPGKVSFVLPCLGRTEIDRNTSGKRQLITVEDSMSMVHGSAGINLPASEHLRSEVRIIAGIAQAVLGNAVVDWTALSEDNDRIRDMIARVLPNFGDFNADVRRPRGFWLRNPAACREWHTPSQRANFALCDLREATEWQQIQGLENTFVLQTIRSHDQYNTTVYGMDDRYRGVFGARNVVFIHPDDIVGSDFAAGDLVDLIGCFDDGIHRECRGFHLVPYDIPLGCLAGYFPELNALVPHQIVGEGSFTPVSKSVIVRLRAHQG